MRRRPATTRARVLTARATRSRTSPGGQSTRCRAVMSARRQTRRPGRGARKREEAASGISRPDPGLPAPAPGRMSSEVTPEPLPALPREPTTCDPAQQELQVVLCVGVRIVCADRGVERLGGPLLTRGGVRAFGRRGEDAGQVAGPRRLCRVPRAMTSRARGRRRREAANGAARCRTLAEPCLRRRTPARRTESEIVVQPEPGVGGSPGSQGPRST